MSRYITCVAGDLVLKEKHELHRKKPQFVRIIAANKMSHVIDLDTADVFS
jgi:hypothetical protein